MATTTTNSPSVKKYVDYAQQQVDEQAILDKYNAATVAQYNLQREQNRAAENQFYNQMYNTQRTAMDTIRQSNAAAVASGASRGVQAANELAAILGLQQESVQGATEIAQANRQTAQEETAAVLENVLNAYNQATQERAQLVQQGIEAASVDAQDAANQIAAQEAATNRMNAETNRMQAETQQSQKELDQAKLIAEAANNGTRVYLNALQQAGIDYSTSVATPESINSLNTALINITKDSGGGFSSSDWKGEKNASNKANIMISDIEAICQAYGLNVETYRKQLNDLKRVASTDVSWRSFNVDDNKVLDKYGQGLSQLALFTIKEQWAQSTQYVYNDLLNKIRKDYSTNNNRITKTNTETK